MNVTERNINRMKQNLTLLSNLYSFQIDNSGSVLEKIAGLYAERLMSDIVLVVGPREFPAHRLILCASSDVFQVKGDVWPLFYLLHPLERYRLRGLSIMILSQTFPISLKHSWFLNLFERWYIAHQLILP